MGMELLQNRKTLIYNFIDENDIRIFNLFDGPSIVTEISDKDL